MLAPAGIDVVYPWWVILFLHVCTALAGARHHLCGGGAPRPRAARRRPAKPSVRAGAQDARPGRRPSGDAAGRVAGRTAGPQPQRDRLGPTALLCGPAGPGHRRAQVPGSRARVAGSALLPAGVRRARAAAVAVGPHPVRDRPQRADGAGRPADRRGAASDDGRGAGGGGGTGHAGSGVGAARDRRHAGRARRHRHDVDVVGHAIGSGSCRRAFGRRTVAA